MRVNVGPDNRRLVMARQNEDEAESVLIVRYIQERDAGSYMCANPDDYFDMATVTVNVEPTNVEKEHEEEYDYGKGLLFKIADNVLHTYTLPQYSPPMHPVVLTIDFSTCFIDKVNTILSTGAPTK